MGKENNNSFAWNETIQKMEEDEKHKGSNSSDFEQSKRTLKNELSDILVRAAILPMAHQYEVIKEMYKMLEYELDGLNSAYEQ